MKTIIKRVSIKEDELLRVVDVVQITKFSRTKVMSLVETGEIPMKFVGGKWLISRTELFEAYDNGFPAFVGSRTRSPKQKLKVLQGLTRSALTELPRDRQDYYKKQGAGLI